MSTTGSGHSSDGYVDFRPLDLQAETGLAAKPAEVSGPLRATPVSKVKYDVGAISWLQSNW